MRTVVTWEPQLTSLRQQGAESRPKMSVSYERVGTVLVALVNEVLARNDMMFDLLEIDQEPHHLFFSINSTINFKS